MHAEQISEFSYLPDKLTVDELYKLNREYDKQLRWRLLEINATDNDVLEWEQELQVKIPDVFKEYLQSYALPITSLYGNIKSEDLSRFTYCEEDNSVRDLLLLADRYVWRSEVPIFI